MIEYKEEVKRLQQKWNEEDYLEKEPPTYKTTKYNPYTGRTWYLPKIQELQQKEIKGEQ